MLIDQGWFSLLDLLSACVSPDTGVATLLCVVNQVPAVRFQLLVSGATDLFLGN
jgi:hypothetical protein